jgi:hypothetical protein
VLLRHEGGCDEVIPVTPLAASSTCHSTEGRHSLLLKTATKQAKFRNPPIAFFRRRQRRAQKTPEGAAPPPWSSGDRDAVSSLGALPPAPTAGVAASPLPHGPPPHEVSLGSPGQQNFLSRVSKAVGAVLPLPKTVTEGRRRRHPNPPPSGRDSPESARCGAGSGANSAYSQSQKDNHEVHPCGVR